LINNLYTPQNSFSKKTENYFAPAGRAGAFSSPRITARLNDMSGRQPGFGFQENQKPNRL